MTTAPGYTVDALLQAIEEYGSHGFVDEAESILARAAELTAQSVERVSPTQATHRWNLEHLPDGSIRICEGDHHRSADCEWVHYVRADYVQAAPAWAAERERVIKTLERYGVSRDRMRGHPSLGIDVLVTRMDREHHAVHAERDQLREGLGDLLTAIENWKKMSPLYGGRGDDGVGTQTQQA